MDEVRRVSGAVSPHYTFLVIDAMTGQDAVATARAFHDALALDGVILTKLDGDARGGAALSVKDVVGRPIAFASTGERLADFDLFHPDRMASRILGMGDVLTLIEQAEREFDHDVATEGATRLLEGRFTLEDFLSQLQQVKKLGSLGGLLSLMPGVPKELKHNANIDDGQVAQVEAIIRSMTPRRAGRARAHRRLAPVAHRPGQRDHHPGGEPAAAPVQRGPAAHALPGDARWDARRRRPRARWPRPWPSAWATPGRPGLGGPGVPRRRRSRRWSARRWVRPRGPGRRPGAVLGPPGGAVQGRPGSKKKKKGGRVTPKGDGGRAGR